MALSDDQKAILRLLAQRGAAGYDDLSALLGISVEEVHKRAKDAAAALEADGIPAPLIPEPVGGAGSPSVAKDGEAPPGEPAPPKPPAKPPVAPAAEPTRALPKGKPKPPLKKELKLLEGRGLWAIVAGVAIVILFVIFIFVSGGDDDSGDSSANASADSCKVTAKAPEPSGKNIEALAVAAVKTGKSVTRAVLDPVDGSEAKGLAVFGRVKNSLALQVAAEGLPPSGECGYTIWLAASPQKMLPLASTKVVKNGVVSAQVEVPVEVLAYLANETFGQLAITRTDESQLKASLAEATKEKKAPVYTGTEVLRGSVAGPIVGAAKRLEAQQKQK
ncbi:MAG TPA: AsnC family protein [Solirubrobacterales bacterium]|nr:AsnC family protein [Solirubrobacterales bacterium]